jgi:prepilin-type N-terminal cleavage/methylation domain-containing protein
MKKKIFGFTLIEILVVISIISVLAGVIYANFNSARAAARDKVRQTSLEELQLAIGLYKAQYGVYPEQGCGGTTVWTGPGTHSGNGANAVDCPEYIVGLVPDFISELPTDPTSEMEHNKGFLYQTNAARDMYKVLVYHTVESDTVLSYDHPFARCPEPAAGAWCNTNPPLTTYSIYSLGAEDL